MSAYAIGVFVLLLGGDGVRAVTGAPVFIALAVALLAGGGVMFVRLRPERFRWYRLPSPLYWFLILATASIAWSQMRVESLVGVLALLATTAAAVVLAYVLSWQELLRTLASALRYLIGLALALELWLALFAGGPLQGLVMSSATFGFLGLLGLVVWGVQLRAGLVRPVFGWFWVAIALAALLLARSATAWAALLAALITLGFALLTRRRAPERRMPVYLTGLGLLAAAAAAVFLAREFVLGLLDRSANLIAIGEIWDAVGRLGAEHPWFGRGWVGSWPDGFVVSASGPSSSSAQGAWLDVWLQLGIVGVLVFAPLVLLTLWRAWFWAVDQPRRGPGPALPYATSSLWPVLVIIALLAQSLASSAMLTGGGWLLLVVIAVKTRFDFAVPSQDTEPTKLPWRRVPIPRGAQAAGFAGNGAGTGSHVRPATRRSLDAEAS